MECAAIDVKQLNSAGKNPNVCKWLSRDEIRVWQTPYPLYDGVGWVDGVYARATWRVRKEGMSRLLPKQEVHNMWNELFFAWKDMLCFGVGNPPSNAIHAELHHLVGVQNVLDQVALE